MGIKQTGRAILHCALAIGAAAILYSAGAYATGEQATGIVTTSKDPVKCQSDGIDGVAFHWCIRRMPGADSGKILWLLHGAAGNERTFFSGAAAPVFRDMLAYWKNVSGTAEPVAIAVSFGQKWTLTELPSGWVAGAPNLYKFFVERVMPYVERKALGYTMQNAGYPQRRMLMGASMGGYNGAQLALKSGLFTKAVLACPAFFTISPYSDNSDISAYESRTGATPDAVSWGLSILGRDMTSLEQWRAFDPLVLAATARNPPAILVSSNDSDAFGFAEGIARFTLALKVGRAQVDQISNSGGHCLIDSAMVNKFAEMLQ